MSRPHDAPATPVPLSLRAAALALAFGTAQAQQAPPPAASAPEATLPEIKASGTRERDNSRGSTGAKFDTPLRDMPQSVTVIDRQLMDSQAATSLKDALRNVPGITLGAGEGGAIGDNINLRGFSARTDIYLDGLRDRGQYTRDMFSLDAVEVLQGPVLDAVRPRLDRRRHQPGQQAARAEAAPARSSATVGTDDYYRVTADINQPLSETARAPRRGVRPGRAIDARRDARRRTGGVAPSIRLGIGTPTEVTCRAAGAAQPRHARLRLPLRCPPRRRAAGASRSTRPSTISTATPTTASTSRSTC